MINWTTLGEVFKITSGGTPLSSGNEFYDNGDIPWVNTGDLKTKYLTIDKIPRKITKPGLENSSAKTIPPNTVLVAINGASIGNCSILKTEAATDQACAAILPVEGQSEEFLYFFMLSIRKELINKGQGGGQLNSSGDILKRTKYPLLPSETQQQIVTVLGKAQSIIDKRSASLQLLDQLLGATFLDMFGDPVSNPKGWPSGTIRDLVESVNYGTSEKSLDKGKYPYIRMNNVTYEGYFDFADLKYINVDKNGLEKYGLKKGDLVFNRTNSKDLVGKTAVFKGTDEVIIAGYLIRIRANSNGNTDYVSGYLNSVHGKATLKNMCKNIIGMANISAQELQGMKILKPPIELQNEYSKIVDYKFSLRNKLTDNLLQIESLFQSLLQKAFSEEGITVNPQELTIQNKIAGIKGLKLILDVLPIGRLPKKEQLIAGQVTINLNKFLETSNTFKTEKELDLTLDKFNLRHVREFISHVPEKSFVPAVTIGGSHSGLLPTALTTHLSAASFPEIKVNNHFIGLLKNMDLLQCSVNFKPISKDKKTNWIFSWDPEDMNAPEIKDVSALKETETKEKKAGPQPVEEIKEEEKPAEIKEEIKPEEKIIESKPAEASKEFDALEYVQRVFPKERFKLKYFEASVDSPMYAHLTPDDIRAGIYKALDHIIQTNLVNHPVTFDELVQALQQNSFCPEFNLLQDYVIDRLDADEPLLIQAYFDEKMASINPQAYYYLEENRAQRRIYLLLNTPQPTEAKMVP